MDKFQYIIQRKVWDSLTTDKTKQRFIRDTYKSLDTYITWNTGVILRKYPIKQSTLILRTLRNCLATYDINKLPTYIPATIANLRK